MNAAYNWVMHIDNCVSGKVSFTAPQINPADNTYSVEAFVRCVKEALKDQ